MPQPASYYNSTSKHNPVLVSFNQEFNGICKLIKSHHSGNLLLKDIDARISNEVFQLWTKFGLLLPKEIYVQKLLELGDFLVGYKEYNVAVWQCFDRYLLFANALPPSNNEIAIDTILKEKYTLLDQKEMGNSIRALTGKLICHFWIDQKLDPKFMDEQHVLQAVTILKGLQRVMQFILPREHLCWLLFNCTVYVYTICRRLMVYGYSNKALEFMLWAATCMESCIPLLSIRYLDWRSTLYSAVCQCFLDLKMMGQAETYAKRGLTKIDELTQLELMSTDATNVQSVPAFRAATIRMGVTIFLKHVHDAKKRQRMAPNRPQRNKSLKDMANNPWPRTSTEKALAEIFEGSAAQFLTITEVVNESNRRVFFTSPAVQEPEDIWNEVYNELFFAGLEIIAGGGGVGQTLTDHKGLNGVVDKSGKVSLMEIASEGKDGVTIKAVFKFLKQMYCFEQWELFLSLAESIQSGLSQDDFLSDILIVKVLLAMEKLNPSAKKYRRFLQLAAESQASMEKGEATEIPTTMQLHRMAAASKKPETIDDYLSLSAALKECTKCSAENVDLDIVIDGCLYLWSKCKSIFIKLQTGSNEIGPYIKTLSKAVKTPDARKYTKLMIDIQHIMCWAGIGNFDSACLADVSLRVGYALEMAAEYGNEHPALLPEGCEYSVVKLLQTAVKALLVALNMLNSGKDCGMSPGSHKTIADIEWLPGRDRVDDEKRLGYAFINDIHCEIIMIYHRLCLKLAFHEKQRDLKCKQDANYKVIGTTLPRDRVLEFEDSCRQNPMSRAFFLMMKSLLHSKSVPGSKKINSYLNEALSLIDELRKEEEELYKTNILQEKDTHCSSTSPPPPILLKKSATYMIFKPGCYRGENAKEIVWYRVFAKHISGPDVKVRLGDNLLNGTGYEVPACDECTFLISNLIPGERYVFAVAAYDYNGQLIGDSIGASTSAILAMQPLPILTGYAFLAQISYQTGLYNISKKALNFLWNHFILPMPSADLSEYTEAITDSDFTLTLYGINQKAVDAASPILQRLFLTSLFISVDMAIREDNLFPNMVCDKGPSYGKQIARFNLCKSLIVAIELSGMLNDSPLCCQAVIQCYGLVVPLIQNEIPSINLIQVLIRIHAVLLELPNSLRVRRQQAITDNIHHMIACITFHLGRLLRIWKQKSCAREIISTGKKLLMISAEGMATTTITTTDSPRQGTPSAAPEPDLKLKKGAVPQVSDTALKDEDGGDKNLEENQDESAETAGDQEKNVSDVGQSVGQSGPGAPTTIKKVKKKKDELQNEELRALQANMLRLSKTVQATDELYGTEDPVVLHAYVSSLSARHAYREVLKFKRRPAYLEFLVQVVQKGITEGKVIQVAEWCDDALSWLSKRHDQLVPKDRNTAVRQLLVSSTTEQNKYGATVAEFSRKEDDAPEDNQRAAIASFVSKGTEGMNEAMRSKENFIETKARNRRKAKLLAYHKKFNPHLTDAERNAKIEIEERALAKIENVLPMKWKSHLTKKRLRRISYEEFPWRSKLNSLYAVCTFAGFVHKLKEQNSFFNSTNICSASFLDQNCFCMDEAGRILVGWKGDGTSEASEINVLEANIKESVLSLTANFLIGNMSNEQTANIEAVDEEKVETPRTYCSDDSEDAPKTKVIEKEEPTVEKMSHRNIRAEVEKIFAYFTRSTVLAYRSHLWILLQNNARILWNVFNSMLLHICSKGDKSVFTLEGLRRYACKALLRTSESLIAMAIHLQIDIDEKQSKINPGTSVIDNSLIFGSQEDEFGGTGLKFESSSDDKTMIDSMFVCKFVLRTLETLYYTERWEALVDLAAKFNAITSCRYVEQVSPLLIYSQHRLIRRAQETSAGRIPTSNFKIIPREPAVPEERYSSYLFSIAPPKEMPISLSSMDPDTAAAALDPTNNLSMAESPQVPVKITLPDPQRAFQVVSVSLDITNSLQTLAHAIDNSNFTSHALRHARRLLAQYLAGQHASSTKVKTSNVQVKFDKRGVAQVPTIMPPDMKGSRFDHEEDVQLRTIPRNQIGTVISAYEHAVDLLTANKKYELIAQALHEIGNLYYHNDNIKLAKKFWCKSIDTIFKRENTIQYLISHNAKANDLSSSILRKVGIWGSLLTGILITKLARYTCSKHLGKRLSYCFIAVSCFKSIFRSTMPHPQADSDYAYYEVGRDQDVTQLIAGIDLFSDTFRADIRVILSCLFWLVNEMIRSKYFMITLPLIVMMQYFACDLCRNTKITIETRLLKVRALIGLNMFGPAAATMIHILYGERLPQLETVEFRRPEVNAPTFKFNQSKPFTDLSALKVIETLVGKKLSAQTAELYGPRLICQISLINSQLNIAIAATFNCMPTNTSTLKFDEEVIEDDDKKKPKKKMKRVGGRTLEQLLEEDDTLSDQETEAIDMTHPLTHCNIKVTENLVKGLLLDSAKNSLQILIETLSTGGAKFTQKSTAPQKKLQQKDLEPMELEILLLSLQSLSAVYRQHLQATVAARTIIKGLRILEQSTYLSGKCDAAPLYNVENYLNSEAMGRLDIRLWIQLRLELVFALLDEIREMGAIGEIPWVCDLGECRQHCAEGVVEAENAGDDQSVAEYLYAAALLDLKEGKELNMVIENLDDALSLLSCAPSSSKMKVPSMSINKIQSGINHLPFYLQNLHVKISILRNDLASLLVFKETDNETIPVALQSVLETYQIILLNCLDAVKSQGEKIDHMVEPGIHSTIHAPIKNLFSPSLVILAHIKMRMAHVISRIAAKTFDANQSGELCKRYQLSIGLLNTSLNLARASIWKEFNLEAEVLFEKGRTLRQLYLYDQVNSTSVASILKEAILISYNFNHDMGLMRQAYLEICLLYMGGMGIPGVPKPTGIDLGIPENPFSKDAIRSQENKPQTASGKKSTSSKKSSKKSSMKDKRDSENDLEKIKRIVWSCMKAAALICQAQHQLFLLPAVNEVLKSNIETEQLAQMPLFCLHDLTMSQGTRQCDLEIPEKPRSEMTDLELIYGVEKQPTPPSVESLISWVHVLGYHAYIDRISAMTNILSGHERNIDNVSTTSHASQEGYSHTFLEVGLQQTFLRTPIQASSLALKTAEIHRFLANNLPAYARLCCAPYPPETVIPGSKDIVSSETPEPIIEGMISKSYPGQSDAVSPMTQEFPIPTDSNSALKIKDGELGMQWVICPLNSISLQKIQLLFYITKKATTTSKAKQKDPIFYISTSAMWIDIAELTTLHDKLMNLLQRADVQLAAVEKMPSRRHQPNVKMSKISKKSVELKKDEKLEDMFKACLRMVVNLFRACDDGLERSQEIPIVPTKVASIEEIEQAFNIMAGNILENSELCNWLVNLLIPPPPTMPEEERAQ